MKNLTETSNPSDFMQLGEKAFEENVHEKLRETLSPNEKQMWITGYLLALTNFKQFQEREQMYSKKEVVNVVDNILQHADKVIDAITNENTDWDAESLVEICKKK